ncbi:expressed unknown protein [Seminavis robusta]|uniref:ER membrane protein complex subunit 10 n=1 Tax=Seminavis robusta TaxID=568900 RepID=A0A9N8EU17_9STRA|nr:expressed unknown protein [Seminavis robusta]|eukprot:Sro1626_g286900.1 n/a (297) ;mRNA; f:17507-18537
MPSSARCHYGLLWMTSLALLLTVQAVTAATLEKSWTLYHSSNGGQDFAHRASIVLSLDPEAEGSVDISISNDNSTLNEQTFLDNKAAGSLYQLKLVEEGSDGSDFILSSVPGCQLLRANFREEIVLTLGPKASAISLTYIPLVSPLAPKSCDHAIWDEKKSNLPEGWDSRISWETATPGMVLRPVMPQYRPPPGLRWLPRIGTNGKLYSAQGPPGGDKEKEGGGPGQQPVDNTPFGFAKRYWYMLLPLFLANFIGSDPPSEEGQSGGGQQQQVGGPPPTAAPAVGGATKKRRGKRD